MITDERFRPPSHFRRGVVFNLPTTAGVFAFRRSREISYLIMTRSTLAIAGNKSERFQLLQEALLSRLCHGVEQHYAVSAAMEMFGKNQAGPRVREAAKYLGLSQRRFIQVFKAEVGIKPKLFSRIQRFQQTRTFIQHNLSINWADLAVDFGYFDQSHLIREFLEFSGLSPTDYINRHKGFIAPNSTVNAANAF